MNTHFEDSSFNQILDMMKHFRMQSTTRSKQNSTLDFSQHSSNQFKQIHTRSPLSNLSTHQNVFQKLYDESKVLQKRRTLLQYQSRRSKQAIDISECTFSPNIRNKHGAVSDPQQFYNKNVQWLQRKQKVLKQKQIQKNHQNLNSTMTFTPRINKFNKKKVIDQAAKLNQTRGVEDFLDRKHRHKRLQQFVQERRKNPYSHVWNVKKGHFSYIK